MIASFKSFSPLIPSSVFVHPSAQVLGDVTVGEYSSIWCNSTIRGDVNSIRIGESTNIQDNCVLHVEHESFPLRIGNSVTVGHAAILHGCTVEDECVIGIGAIILNGATIGRGSVVAAGTLVPEGAAVPPGSLLMGVPSKIRRQVSEQERIRFKQNAQHYVDLAKQYLEQRS